MAKHTSKPYYNVFEALELPYETAALKILQLVTPSPSVASIVEAASMIRVLVEKATSPEQPSPQGKSDEQA